MSALPILLLLAAAPLGELELQSAIKQAQRSPAVEDRIEQLSRLFLGMPYAQYPLGEESGVEPHATADIPEGSFSIRYLPLAEARERAAQLAPGSVMLIVRAQDPQRVVRVSHMALVVRTAAGLVVRHASFGREKKVIEEPIAALLTGSGRIASGPWSASRSRARSTRAAGPWRCCADDRDSRRCARCLVRGGEPGGAGARALAGAGAQACRGGRGEGPRIPSEHAPSRRAWPAALHQPVLATFWNRADPARGASAS